LQEATINQTVKLEPPLAAFLFQRLRRKSPEKVSEAQGVGLYEPDYPCVSEDAVSRSESAPQRDAAASDHPTKGGRENAREPCHFLLAKPKKKENTKGV
jgi:hypothetical protein